MCEACIYITIKLILMKDYICTLYKVEGQVMPSGIGSLHGIIVTYASSEKIYTYTL